MARPFRLRTAFALWIGATVGAVCVLPYVASLTPALEQAVARSHLPVPLLVALSVVQSAVTLGVLTFAGLWAAGKLGMGAPWLDAWTTRTEAPPGFPRHALVAGALGLGIGVALLALDVFVFLPLSPAGVGPLLRARQPPVWQGLLASLEGGVTEEVELRLFVLSLLALGIAYVARAARHRPALALSPAVFWTANVVAAVLFGLGHLPITAKLVALTPLVVTRAIVLNGALGVVAGFLFWRRGIEMAIVCHFSADIVLHAVAPAMQGWLLRL